MSRELRSAWNGLGLGLGNLYDANVGMGIRITYGYFTTKVSVLLDQLDKH